MNFGEMTYLEIKQAAREGWIGILPTGCTEQQSTHLPVDFDTWLAQTLCITASKKAEQESGVSSLVLPALPYGPTPEHRGFGAGYIDLPQSLHEQLVKAILRSLVQQGFRRIIIWRGCGQHRLTEVVDSFEVEAPGALQVILPEMPFHRVWQEVGFSDLEGGHADALATSIALHLRPGAVRKEKIEAPIFSTPDWSDPGLDLSQHSNTGSIGDPSPASEALGKRLWEATVRETVKIIVEFDRRSP